MKYNVIIIGAGSIGAWKELEKVDRHTDALTHAKALFYHNDKFNLIGIYDTNREFGERAARKWDTKYLDKLIDADIYVVACPTEFHFEVMFDVIKFNPALVICEKPFCEDSLQAKKIIKDYPLQIPIVVNYSRRFSRAYQKMQEKFDIKHYGNIYSASFLYSRGLLREGSHAIDLCNWFFGKILYGRILSTEGLNDYNDSDITFPVHLQYRNCPNVFFSPTDGRNAYAFENTIMSEKAKIVFGDYGQDIHFYPVNIDGKYGKYFSLKGTEDKSMRITTDLNKTLYNLYQNVFEYLEDRRPLQSTYSTAIKVHEIHEFLLNNTVYSGRYLD